MTWAAIAAITLTLSAGVLGSQRPTFQAGVELVEVDAVARTADGGMATGLRREDVEIREDGRPVEIKTFVAVNADIARTDADGRFIVLLLDNVVSRAMFTTN